MPGSCYRTDGVAASGVFFSYLVDAMRSMRVMHSAPDEQGAPRARMGARRQRRPQPRQHASAASTAATPKASTSSTTPASTTPPAAPTASPPPDSKPAAPPSPTGPGRPDRRLDHQLLAPGHEEGSLRWHERVGRRSRRQGAFAATSGTDRAACGLARVDLVLTALNGTDEIRPDQRFENDVRGCELDVRVSTQL